ncbi:MAG TPA: uroporphyrinogen-III synthase [Terracidiphilus sp.]|nr:uroporphyrinogen-III synthase [Terracidiphilus sp.]
MTPPLAGRRVLITRAAHQAGKLSAALRALGLEPVEVPVLEIRPPASFDALDAALRNLAAYDWLILTSTNTVAALANRAKTLALNLPALAARVKIATIGSATAQTATEAGLPPALLPRAYVAESLVEALGPQASGSRILLARAALARDVIPDALRAAGAVVDVVDAYANAIPAAAPAQLRAALRQGIDAAAFTSSSSVTHLAQVAKAAGLAFPLEGIPAVSIGPITSQTLREHSWPPAAEANPHDIPSLAQAVARFLATSL